MTGSHITCLASKQDMCQSKDFPRKTTKILLMLMCISVGTIRSNVICIEQAKQYKIRSPSKTLQSVTVTEAMVVFERKIAKNVWIEGNSILGWIDPSGFGCAQDKFLIGEAGFFVKNKFEEVIIETLSSWVLRILDWSWCWKTNKDVSLMNYWRTYQLKCFGSLTKINIISIA